jgi:pimeloyl-ACP methyl ester carboxylesterase
MTSSPAQAWSVRSHGATLAVYGYGSRDPAAPTVLLVHGYPDDHHLWDGLIAELSDEARLISYDTRVAGRSRVDDPRGLDPFRMSVLADDLYAVLDSIPDCSGPVHLVAHDWGSVQSWEAVRRPRAATAFASYLSVSGPSVDHLRQWNLTHIGHPTQWPTIAGQLLRSWYVFGYATPGVRRLAPRAFAWAARNDYDDLPRDSSSDLVRGTALYRANILQRMLSGPVPSCLVPTTVVVPTRDRFLSTRMAEGMEEWIPDLDVINVHAGHWWPRTHPREAAMHLRARFGTEKG